MTTSFWTSHNDWSEWSRHWAAHTYMIFFSRPKNCPFTVFISIVLPSLYIYLYCADALWSWSQLRYNIKATPHILLSTQYMITTIVTSIVTFVHTYTCISLFLSHSAAFTLVFFSFSCLEYSFCLNYLRSTGVLGANLCHAAVPVVNLMSKVALKPNG